MGQGFIVMGGIRKSPLTLRSGGQAAVLAAYVRKDPLYQFEGLDISRTAPRPVLKLGSLYNIHEEGELSTPQSAVVSRRIPEGLEEQNPSLNQMRRWYAQLPPPETSLWENARLFRRDIKKYVTVLPRILDDLEDFEYTLTGTLPELRQYDGRIQKSMLYREELSEAIERIIHSVRKGEGRQELESLVYLFPMSAGTSEAIANSIRKARTNPKDRNMREVEKLLRAYASKSIRKR